MIKEKYCLGCSRLAGKQIFHPIAQFAKRLKKLSGEHISHWQAHCRAAQIKEMRVWRQWRRSIIGQTIKEIHENIRGIKTPAGVFEYLEGIEKDPTRLKAIDRRRYEIVSQRTVLR